MADPRFYQNRGPIALGDLCAKLDISLPQSADPASLIFDIAGLAQAGPQHISLFDGSGRAQADFAGTKAGWCLLPRSGVPDGVSPPSESIFLPVTNVTLAFAAAGKIFYATDEFAIEAQECAVHPSAVLGENVVVGPGAVIGPNVEIGARSRIGAGAVIARGVTIGTDAEVGAGAWVGFAHLGDDVAIGPGVRIGGPGFGFASSASGHVKLPQLGRVIVQDRVDIGANSTIDRGALADTVIGEGTKIDNLVQIGHNTVIGRHCIIVSQTGISGSVVLGDFVVLGGQVGVTDHVTIGSGARVASTSGVAKDLPGGQDYSGLPARPVKQWRREVAALSLLAKSKRTKGPGPSKQ